MQTSHENFTNILGATKNISITVRRHNHYDDDLSGCRFEPVTNTIHSTSQHYITTCIGSPSRRNDNDGLQVRAGACIQP